MNVSVRFTLNIVIQTRGKVLNVWKDKKNLSIAAARFVSTRSCCEPLTQQVRSTTVGCIGDGLDQNLTDFHDAQSVT